MVEIGKGAKLLKLAFFRSSFWNKTVEYYGIVRWLYLEDVLSNEEDK